METSFETRDGGRNHRASDSPVPDRIGDQQEESMKRRHFAIACLIGVVASRVGVADDAKTVPAAPPDEKAMMEGWARLATPGPGHQALQPLVGNWDAKITTWMAPGAPATISEGVSENRWILGGRYLEQKYDGKVMGQTVSGLGYTAYDNFRKQYLGAWMDTMGTSILEMSGSADPSGKIVSMEGKIDDFMSGKPVSVQSKVRILDDDHNTWEMWSPAPDGKMFKTMEIEYSRRK
jgi:uncharacterized protein DUF1579